MKSLTPVLDEARADSDKTSHNEEAQTSTEISVSKKRPKYAYCAISDSSPATSEFWIAMTTNFLDYLADGYEIVSFTATQNSVHYILRQGGE